MSKPTLPTPIETEYEYWDSCHRAPSQEELVVKLVEGFNELVRYLAAKETSSNDEGHQNAGGTDVQQAVIRELVERAFERGRRAEWELHHQLDHPSDSQREGGE